MVMQDSGNCCSNLTFLLLAVYNKFHLKALQAFKLVDDAISTIFLIQSSRKHTYIILTPLKPYFYIVKLGFTGV